MSSDSEVEESGSRPEIVPWIDGLDRVERQIERQLEADRIGKQKAEYVTGFVSVLIGIILAVTTLANESQDASIYIFSPEGISFILGFIGLIVTIVLANIAYVKGSVAAGFAPSAIDRIADEELTADQYRDGVLGSYKKTVKYNREGLWRVRVRIARTLVLLMISILYLAFSVFLLAIRVPSDFRFQGWWGILHIVNTRWWFLLLASFLALILSAFTWTQLAALET